VRDGTVHTILTSVADADERPLVGRAACDAAVLLARQVGAAHMGAIPIARRRKPGWVAAAAAGCVFALTGAGTLAAHQLGIPPFQTTDPGTERAMRGVSITYTNSLHRQVDCLAFIEYRNLDAAERDRIEQVAGDGRWQGYGQRTLDRLGIPDATPEAQNQALTAVVFEDLWQAARSEVPGLAYMTQSNGPVFTGSSISCAGPGGVDGRP